MAKKSFQKDKYTLFEPDFYAGVFAEAIVERKKVQPKNALEALFVEEYGELSRALDKSKLQDSVAVRNVLRTRKLAQLLIDDQGHLNKEAVVEALSLVENHLCFTGPDQQYDLLRHRHIYNVLQALHTDQELVRALHKISKPYGFAQADQIIRDTLVMPYQASVGDAETRRAALSAWFCYLRQKVGSCFATAPAIIIHDEQPLAFLKDLDELLSTGRLKRTFGGIEYSAPLSPSWGSGELRKPCLVPREEKFGQNNLWLSPGLLAALEAVNLIDREQPLKERLFTLKGLIQALFMRWPGSNPYLYVTAEKILRQLLLDHLHLDEEALKAYEKRSRQMVQSSLLHHSPRLEQQSGGQAAVCAQFNLLIDAAQKAFKQLADNALLKSWEFTVASFAETKATFSRWNFYASLGLNQDDEGGIGPMIYETVAEKLEELKREQEQLQDRYDQLYGLVRHLEVRLRTAGEQEGQWLKAELKTAVGEFQSVEQMRDKVNQTAHRVAELYALLVEVYDAIFPRYFQEVYDADIQEVSTGPYDDSPAGFRLVYKFGRSNSSQWAAIRNADEFIEMLVNFFVATENELQHNEHLVGLEHIIGQIVSKIVGHIRTPRFLESALYRMAQTQGGQLIENPLDHMDLVEKKPWVYTSGGSMSSLVSCYFGLEEPPTSNSRWVENCLELLTYLVDTLKLMPEKDKKLLYGKQSCSLLMHSPTHAFIFKPNHDLLQRAVAEESFTYTWLRDNYAEPRQRFVDNVFLDEAKMAYLVERLSEIIPWGYRVRFKEVFTPIYGGMSPIQFREHILERLQLEQGLQRGGQLVLTADQIDELLYAQIPLIAAAQLPKAVGELLKNMSGMQQGVINAVLKQLEGWMPTSTTGKVLGAKGLLDLVKALIVSISGKTSMSYDLHLAVAQSAQELGYAMPKPIIFADTNWEKELFAFTVNPGTGSFELWCMDYTGSVGHPISSWSHWLDGSHKKPTWGLFTRPHEIALRVM